VTDRYYDFTPDSHTSTLLEKADQLNVHVSTLKNINSSLWETILLKLKIDWTYNSNSIEGSTLSLGDTHFFLTEGLTIEGKPFRDFLDAKNHMEAIEYLYEIVEFLNERIKQLQQKAVSFSAKDLMVLTALNIVDEYFKLKKDYESILKKIEIESKKLIKSIETLEE